MYLAICVSADQGSFWFLFNVKFTNHEDEEMREKRSSHFFVFTDILHYYSDALLFFSLSAKLQCSSKQWFSCYWRRRSARASSCLTLLAWLDTADDAVNCDSWLKTSSFCQA